MKFRVSSINLFPSKKQGKRCRKKHLSKEAIRKIVLGFIGVPERKKTMQITKRHLMQLQLKSDNLKEAMNKN